MQTGLSGDLEAEKGTHLMAQVKTPKAEEPENTPDWDPGQLQSQGRRAGKGLSAPGAVFHFLLVHAEGFSVLQADLHPLPLL